MDEMKRRHRDDPLSAARRNIGRRYRHYKGEEYTITGVFRDEASGQVHYRYVDDEGNEWGRWVGSWDHVVDEFPDGDVVLRFTEIDVPTPREPKLTDPPSAIQAASLALIRAAQDVQRAWHRKNADMKPSLDELSRAFDAYVVAGVR